ncbi:tail protein (tape measure) [Pantoea sp. App145]|uniref:tail protein (tape measure) n=1 Tax=Pantoea sp. App145 TaxID=3071567 RepID=UPI003A809E2D
MAEEVGKIYYDVDIETAKLLMGARQVEEAMGGMDSAAKTTGKSVDNLGKDAKATASLLDQISSHAKSMDGSLQSLNTTFSAVATAISQANTNSTAASMTLAQMNAAMQTLISSVNSMASAMKESSSSTAAASSEYSRAESIIEGLGNQIAILEEANENGARSAAVLAAQLRAGSAATDEEKQRIGQLTGQLFDMKSGVDQGTKSHGNWKSSMQQAGYQVQDFIVQVQGGQSALVAFSQQGSQLAGAFGPGGAVVGAVIALGSVLTGVLMSALGSTGNEMDKLSTAADTLNKVVVINSQGVAALSNDYARLAVTNATLAAQLRDNAIANYEIAVRDAGKAIQSIVKDQSSWFDSLQGGSASVAALGEVINTLNIKTDSFRDAFAEASKTGIGVNNMANTLTATVSMLGSQFSIGDDAAFGLAKRLNDLAKNPSPQAVSDLIKYMKDLTPATKDGADAMVVLETKVLAAGAAMQKAQDDSDALTKKLQDLRTEAQQANFDSVSKQLETQRIALTKGKQAAVEYGIEQQDLTGKQKEELIAKSRVVAALEDEAEKRKKAESEAKSQANAQESVAQKLANLKQQSELAATSTTELSREQAILTAQLSLGKGATQEQITLAGQYAAKKWDTANALKAQAAAEKLLPEAKENASYAQDVKDLQTAYDAKKITQQQYNQTSEQLEQQHQINLAKIRAQQVVSPVQQAQGEVDPVQQLANQHAQELALIQQFEQQGVIAHENAIALKTAADTEYEKQRTDAQWQLLSQQSLGYNMLTSAVDAFSGNASNAITGLITGTMSAQEALRSLGNTILNSVINSIVQVGVEALKNYILGQTLGAASVAASVGMATATAAAWAPAAALASLASFGANAAPAAAGITSTVGLANGLALAGARYNGGPVSAGGLYQVGENGKPEIYKASNGSQYMIPGDNGSVISNKDLQGGTGSMQVTHNVYNYASGVQVDTQSSQSSNGQLLVETFITDMENGGPMSSQMQQTFGLNRKATGDY